MKKIILLVITTILWSLAYPQAYWIYLQGNESFDGTDSIQPNYDKAYWLYKKAAQMGCPMAKNKIGLCYYLGHGVEQSFRKSFIWTRESARSGYSEAQYQLGCMYMLGEGCRKNSKRGYKWIYRAADRGNAEAIEYLQQFSLYPHVKYMFEKEN